MTGYGAEPPAWRRRVLQDLAASARPEAGEASEPDGTAQWDNWYQLDIENSTLGEQLRESKYDFARRAFLAGWLARDDAERDSHETAKGSETAPTLGGAQ